MAGTKYEDCILSKAFTVESNRALSGLVDERALGELMEMVADRAACSRFPELLEFNDVFVMQKALADQNGVTLLDMLEDDSKEWLAAQLLAASPEFYQVLLVEQAVKLFGEAAFLMEKDKAVSFAGSLADTLCAYDLFGTDATEEALYGASFPFVAWEMISQGLISSRDYQRLAGDKAVKLLGAASLLMDDYDAVNFCGDLRLLVEKYEVGGFISVVPSFFNNEQLLRPMSLLQARGALRGANDRHAPEPKKSSGMRLY